MRFRGVLYGVILLFAAAGCAAESPGGAPARAPSPVAWVEPANYKFSFDSSCGERALLGKFRAEVANGAVVATEGLDDSGRRALMLRVADLVPTLGEMVDEAHNSRGATTVVVIERDPADGHPVKISSDDPNSIDEEICYTISDYTIGGSPGPQASPSR